MIKFRKNIVWVLCVAGILALIFNITPNANADTPVLYSNNTSLPRRDAVDISNYQSWLTQDLNNPGINLSDSQAEANFNALKNQGVKTVVILLTQGTYFINPYAARQIKFAQSAGLNIAVYHYATLTDPNNQAEPINQVDANDNAIAEAKYFVAEAKILGIPATTAMIFDAEDGDVNANIIDWTIASQAWESEMKNLLYSNDKFYTSVSWTNALYYAGIDATTGKAIYNRGSNLMEEDKLGTKNMWISQYPYNPTSSNLLNTQFGAWQYSDNMHYIGTSQNLPVDTSIDYSNLFSPFPFTLTGMTWQNLSRTKVNFGIASSNYSSLTFTWKIYNLQTQQWSLVATSTSNWVTIDFPKSGSYLVYVEATNPQGQSSNYCIGWNIAPAFTLQGMTWVFHGSNVNTDFGIAYQSDEVLNFIWQIYDVQKNTWTTISNRSTSNWVNYNFPHQGNYLVHVTAISTSGDTASYDIGWQIN